MSASEQSRAARVGRGTGLVLAGAVGATVITGIAFAQSGQVDAAAGAAYAAGDSGSGGHRFGGPGTGPVLHGQETVRTRDGQFINILIQNGELTAVSASSATVKSDDGFTATYSITAATEVRLDRAEADTTKLAVGRPVRIIANEDRSARLVSSSTVEGQAAMAERHHDLRGKFRHWRHEGTVPEHAGDSTAGDPA
jgi:hypothetical protein